MWTQTILLTGIISLDFFQLVSASGKGRVACYYGSWSTYRKGNGQFDVEDIDPTLCTHAIYAFVGINGDGSVRILDPWNEIGKKGLERFNNLKLKNPALKTMIAVGGWNEGSTVFSEVANSSTLRANFVKSAASLLQVYGYDGFDLDWEYPCQRGGGSYDKANFATLLKEFREEFDKHGYLLSAAVAAASTSADLSYDVPNLSRYLDFVNVMTYDLHGAWEGYTGQNSPLYPSSKDSTPQQKSLNADACIRGWIARGAEPQKLNLGMGAYGRSFTLQNPDKHGLYAPVFNGGKPGPYTQESGMLGYNEICEHSLTGDWNVTWDDEQKVPYSYSGNQWVGYDNPKSVTLKVEYARSLGLGGVMIWSVDTDDFRGASGTRYPLLNAINYGLGSDGAGTTTESGSVSGSGSSTTSTGTSSPGNSAICNAAGFVRDPKNCSKFYYCQPSGDSYVQLGFQCANGLVFDTNLNVCNYPSDVQC